MDPVAELVSKWLGSLSGGTLRVALADGDDPRTVAAARKLADTTPVRPLLLSGSGGQGSGVDVLAPADVRRDPAVAGELEAALSARRMPPEEQARLTGDPLYLGAATVRAGLADACVGGAARPTADVIRAGIRVLGLATDAAAVTSCFLMVLPGGQVVAYADCAVVPDPDPAQLADIAVWTSRTFTSLTGQDPAVAMLSFSTKGSASHRLVERVRAATGLIQSRSPELLVDGELQFDAAFTQSVAARKAAGSPVAGRANVFVFPNLDAGNIAYKITERLARAAAIGPILQGLSAPMNDLSRGCGVDDVVRVALVSAVQAAQRRSTEPAPASALADTSIADTALADTAAEM